MNQVQTDNEKGNALYVQGRYAEAAECYRAALRQRPDDVDALNNLGAALADLGRLSDAVGCYQEALRHQPAHVHAHYNLGNALRLAGRLEESVASYGQALLLHPDFGEGHNNLGIALRRLGRQAEALSSFRRALELKPSDTAGLVNLGLALADQGRLVEALACYDESLRREPAHADAHHNRALAWLLMGDYARGWSEYQWRWRCSEFSAPGFSQPLWDGARLDGRTILLHCEQGLGDTLQMVRYAPLVKQRGATVILSGPRRLLPVLGTVAGIDRLVAADAPPPEFDVYCPLLSLPAAFATTLETVPAQIPYLRAEPERIERWRKALEPIAGFRVGIAWQGSPTMLPYNRLRSIPLDRFEPLARVEGVRLISLQLGTGAEQIKTLDGRFAILDLTGRLDESAGAFLDTAAVMANLDLVITCDTALAHLAGALGVATWVALPAVPDWRWLLDRDDSPWYPTARLFRQTRAGQWDEPFACMAEALRTLTAMRTAPASIPIEIPPGELIDRLVILEIKADRITDPDKLRNVRLELATLTLAAQRTLGSDPQLACLAAELRKVNEAIWDAEDTLRRCEADADFGPDFITQARSVYRHNDARAALKRRINEHLQCDRQEDKQHPRY